MDGLVRSASTKLNVEEDVAETAVGAILNFIKKHYVSDEGSLDFDKIMETFEGAQKILKKEEVREESIRPGVSAQTAGATSTATTKSSSSTIVGLVLHFLKAFGILSIIKTFLETIFGESATKMIESVEDGADLLVAFRELKITREQGLEILKMVWVMLQDKLDEKTLDRINKSIPAIQSLLKNFKKDE